MLATGITMALSAINPGVRQLKPASAGSPSEQPLGFDFFSWEGLGAESTNSYMERLEKIMGHRLTFSHFL